VAKKEKPNLDLSKIKPDTSGLQNLWETLTTGASQRRVTLGGGLEKYYGFKKKDWETLLGKGGSLTSLGSGDVKELLPELSNLKEIKEKETYLGTVRRFRKTTFLGFKFSKLSSSTDYYTGSGMEATLGDEWMAKKSREGMQNEYNRVLGLFSKRKEEASLRQRAPGRGATMLTAPGKSTLTGY
jgi:hypothetical protein